MFPQMAWISCRCGGRDEGAPTLWFRASDRQPAGRPRKARRPSLCLVRASCTAGCRRACKPATAPSPRTTWGAGCPSQLATACRPSHVRSNSRRDLALAGRRDRPLTARRGCLGRLLALDRPHVHARFCVRRRGGCRAMAARLTAFVYGVAPARHAATLARRRSASRALRAPRLRSHQRWPPSHESRPLALPGGLHP